ncbi:hypothetical protein LWI29_009549 [Acer saccharum]|uniref:Early nodulin-93-like n=1 Tax=Acer saccharum TaxID=4024 RepID=A0AA39RCD9_ACESA|nr:hypothetical protein LWI29_009549 [Acer saccharum]KAK1549387.1 hypothetical protein Q3G72_001250 [Acer saccharum]
MGIPSEARDIWENARRKNSVVIPSPAEDHKAAKDCVQEGVRAGLKAAVIACVASAVPTLVAVRTIPWAKANLNYTGQALVISGASIAAYFITVDKTILECARRNAQYNKRA